MGVSTGNFGTLRAQLHLRQILTHVGALTLGKPEVLVGRAEQVFDAQGHLADPYLLLQRKGVIQWTKQPVIPCSFFLF